MNFNISQVIGLMNMKKYHESLNILNKLENEDKENFEILNLKGFIYLKLNKFVDSINYLTKALAKKNRSFHTLCYRSGAYSEVGDYEKAVIDLKKAQKINPQSYDVYLTLGDAYSNLGENDKSIEFFLKSLELKPNFDLAIEYLIKKIAEKNSFQKDENKIVKTNLLINKINYKYSLSKNIEEDVIHSLFVESNKIISENLKNLTTTQTQIFRRNDFNLNCDRHFRVFNNFKAIPNFCFSCFKVTVEVESVLDLIKLYLIFDNISLPNDNIRKCMIELRPNVQGTYKGFIYCRSLNEAKEVEILLSNILAKNIKDSPSPKLKKGCTEFSNKYPEYKNLENEIMDYNKDWEKFEDIVDKTFPKFKIYKKDERSIKGITLSDILIIKNWLYFARLIGDDSYKKISNDKFINNKLKEKFLTKKNNLEN